MRKRKNNFTQWVGILCIFSVFMDKAVRGAGLPFDFYFYYPVYIIFLISMGIQYKKLVVPPLWLNAPLFFIFAISLLITLSTGRLGMEFVKQVIGISLSVFVFYNVLYVFSFDTKRVFDIYLSMSFWVALHGVIDNILHIAGIHLTTTIASGPFMYREYGIMGEPFYLTMALSPAVVYYMCFFKRTWADQKFRFIVLIICYLITYSSIAVTGLCLGVFFALYVNDFFSVKKNKFVMAPLLAVPIFLGINFLIDNIELINARFTDTTALFFNSFNTDNIQGTNSSTFALYSNFIIAKDAFLNNPLFGAGLGSHPIIFEETFLKYFPQQYLDMYGAQNQQDANSKFFRLMSETGLVGLFIFFAALVSCFARKKQFVTLYLKELGSINYAIFVYILLGLIRNGNYINIGFFLFFFLYCYTSKQISRGYHLHVD